MSDLVYGCEDCGCFEFTIYNYEILVCSDCGQLKDMPQKQLDEDESE